MGLDDQYEITKDPYVDPNSGALRNLLGIADPVLFHEAEQAISYIAISILLAEQPFTLEQIDFDALRDCAPPSLRRGVRVGWRAAYHRD
ncbi:MAG: hypothetical protein LBR20_08200 [Propionibacteriaceae bacterium]|jgi:hypothetical protein|nr:hypothetical protein [Propionibacteriaceae bacterium]